MKILKFGGSSLATPARVREVGRIVLAARRQEAVILVVSAFQGVTNDLIACARAAERGDTRYLSQLSDLSKRHRSAVRRLVRGRMATAAEVDKLLAELRETVQGIHLLRH